MKASGINNAIFQTNTNIPTENNKLKLIIKIISVILFCFGVTILPIGCLLSSTVIVAIGVTLISLSLLLFALQTNSLIFSKSHKQKKQIPEDSQQIQILKQKQFTQEIVPKVQTIPTKPVKQPSKQMEQLKCQTEKIYANFKEIFSKDWRLGVDKNGHVRYVCITYPVSLFLSKQKGSLFTPLSSTPNRPFAIAADINDPHLPEKNKLLNLIPSQFTQKTLNHLSFTDNISFSPKNLDQSSTNQPFHLICVKGLYNLPLTDHNGSISTEEQEALNDTLFNLLKTSYVKLLEKAIEARVQILQLTLLKAPFPQLNKKNSETLSQTALLQAIREVTYKHRSLDILQEIIICLPTKT